MGRTEKINPLSTFWTKYQKQIVAGLIILALFIIGEIATGHFLSAQQSKRHSYNRISRNEHDHKIK